MVQAYLELEKLQFETRLKWRIEANVESRQAMVPPMFVQQLVENAVKHGISQQAEGGEISVNASLRDGRLEVKVENTGRLAEPLGRGFGIANARDRFSCCAGNYTRVYFGIERPLVLKTLNYLGGWIRRFFSGQADAISLIFNG